MESNVEIDTGRQKVRADVEPPSSLHLKTASRKVLAAQYARAF
jgi:hypothetical protein